MGDYGPRGQINQAAPLSAGSVMRAIASLIGLGIIILGLVFAVQTFLAIRDSVTKSAAFQETVKKWVEVLGGDEAGLKIKDEMVPVARVGAMAAVFGGYFVMAWLSIGIMVAGARIISWTTGDREAVRQIIREAMGPRGKV